MKLKKILIQIIKENNTNKINWVKPAFKTEESELMNHFMNWIEDDVLKVNFDDLSEEEIEDIKNKIYNIYENSKIETLTDEEWSKMENTDSWNIKTMDDLYDVINGYWGRSKERIDTYSINPIKNGGTVETPIVAYAEGHPPYLIGGNTRLSACRVLGVIPKVTKMRIKL